MRSIHQVLWVLPLAFVIHDGEEILTMPGWIARNRPVLDRIAEMGALARRVVENLASTTSAVSAAVFAELAVIVLVTFVAQRRPQGRPTMYAYAAILGVFFLHSLTHVGSAIILRSYTPGLISATLVVPAASIYVYQRLFSAGLLNGRSAALSAAAGAALVVPAVVAAHYFGRSF